MCRSAVTARLAALVTFVFVHFATVSIQSLHVPTEKKSGERLVNSLNLVASFDLLGSSNGNSNYYCSIGSVAACHAFLSESYCRASFVC